MSRIVQLVTLEEWKDSFKVMGQLRTHLSEEPYLELLEKMAAEGYKLFALYDEAEIAALAGVIIQTNLYDGRHVFVYDLITDGRKRSKGYGAELISFLERWGKEQGCERIALTSGVQRKDAHRFYQEKMGFHIPSYSFKKDFS